MRSRDFLLTLSPVHRGGARTPTSARGTAASETLRASFWHPASTEPRPGRAVGGEKTLIQVPQCLLGSPLKQGPTQNYKSSTVVLNRFYKFLVLHRNRLYLYNRTFFYFGLSPPATLQSGGRRKASLPRSRPQKTRPNEQEFFREDTCNRSCSNKTHT